MPRRYYAYLPEYQLMHQISTIGSWILAVGLFWTLGYLIASLIKTGKKAARRTRGAAPPSSGTPQSPPIEHNFHETAARDTSPYDFPEIDWLFLATEILMFSGLFLAYFITRMFYPEMVLGAHEHLSKTAGGINTIVLLTSSYTMALAVRSAQTSNTAGIKRFSC
jgi:hypothetical protein